MCIILIEIEGGTVQRVLSDRAMTIVVVDRDNDRDDKFGLVDMIEPDAILLGGEKLSKSFWETLDEQDQVIAEKLESLGL